MPPAMKIIVTGQNGMAFALDSLWFAMARTTTPPRPSPEMLVLAWVGGIASLPVPKGREEHSQLYKDKHTRPHSETQILYETLHRPTLHVLHRNAVPLDHAFHGATKVRHDWSTSG